MIDDKWIKIIFLIYSSLIALGIFSQLFREKLNRKLIIILSLREREVLKDICREVLVNRKWGVSRERALVLNKVLDKLEEVKNER